MSPNDDDDEKGRCHWKATGVGGGWGTMKVMKIVSENRECH